MRRFKLALILLAAMVFLLGVALVAASLASAGRFRKRFETETFDLRRAALAERPFVPSTDALPPPVQRYLDQLPPAADKPLRVAVLSQSGSLRTSPGAVWMPFVAEQAYTLSPPGFTWFADATAAPFVHVLARDTFVEGQGSMVVRVLGLFTVADAKGPELDQGAALRFWGEVVAFPEAVRHPALRWSAIDDTHARLDIEQGSLKLSGAVSFNEAGLPSAFDAPRFRDVDGKGVLTPWSGRFFDWKVVDGRLFPTRWTATWQLPEGEFEAVRIEVRGLKTE